MPKIIYDKVLRQTAKAVQYEIDGKQVWIPESQIIGWEDLGNHILDIPMWLIKNNGLESYLMEN